MTGQRLPYTVHTQPGLADFRLTTRMHGILMFITSFALFKPVILELESKPRIFFEPMPFQKNALRISNIEWDPVEPTWAIVQYEDRLIEEPILEMMLKNKAYCESMGYAYIFVNTKYGDIPPYWAKVQIVNEILQLRFSDSNDHVYAGVMWMDTDAVINDDKRRIEQIGHPEKVFFGSPDPSGIGMSAKFNAGVWIVKNSVSGRAIMIDWMKSFDTVNWINSEGKWSAKHSWAGETFEQGAFEKHVLPKYSEIIDIMPWYVLQGVDKARTDSFALHLFSCGPSLAAGLIRVDRTILRILRTKHAQGIDSTIPPGLLLTYKVNLGAALLEIANHSGDKSEFMALYDEAEQVLLSGLELEPTCSNCMSSLASVRKNRLLRS